MIYWCFFEPDKKKERIKALEEEMAKPDFWSDKKNSETIIEEVNYLKNTLNKTNELKDKIETSMSMLDELKTTRDNDIELLLKEEVDELKEEISSLQINILLSGPYDKENAIFEIHSGAGGTEACDWANMLYRMYTRYFEKNNYKVEVIDLQPGEEVGIKSVSMLVKGYNTYGYLKGEKGVHRLIRISPFDSNKRRHTSFASVNVSPLFNNSDININIDEKDLRIDVYHSSGAGGQSVNTTDSAVRITHIPTKIVVTCQNERSQLQNKEKAMEILKNRLYELELEKREEELAKVKGVNSDINFGNQIRTYTMHSYSLVKDHRTNVETNNVESVLDGNIDMFINAYLKKGVVC